MLQIVEILRFFSLEYNIRGCHTPYMSSLDRGCEECSSECLVIEWLYWNIGECEADILHLCVLLPTCGK